MCISPINVELAPKIRENVPCGKCYQCLNSKRDEWTFRLENEQKVSNTSLFLTLTYDQENVPLIAVPLDNYRTVKVPTLKKEDLQSFIKNLRHHQKRKSKDPITLRYYAVGEYGTKYQRPHYHLILFNLNKNSIKHLDKIWKKGRIDVGTATTAAIKYVTKYVINKDKETSKKIGREVEFATMSRRPGLGENYTHSFIDYHRETAQLRVRMNNGTFIPLPRYYREKMFSKDEWKKYLDTIIENSNDVEAQEIIRCLEKGENYYFRVMENHRQKIDTLNSKLNSKSKF